MSIILSLCIRLVLRPNKTEVLRGHETRSLVGAHGPTYGTAAIITVSTIVQGTVIRALKLRAATARGFDIVYIPGRDLLRSSLQGR